MTEQFWHSLITDKSYAFLKELRRNFDFVLIGGWAVYFYTKALKSKDIDIIVDFETLGRMRENFDLVKNDRLKKYEIRAEGFDVDIYVPHWSELGLPLDFVMKNAVSVEGFTLPKKEILLLLKLYVYTQRSISLKGKKDLIDIISLLYFNNPSWDTVMRTVKSYKLESLLETLREILKTTYEMKELGLNRKQFSDFKKPILKKLSAENS